MTPINYKLINLLNSLSYKEVKEFKKFVSSPFYTKGRNYLPLLNLLIEHHSMENGENVNLYIHDIYSKLYPGKKFSNQTLKNRFSELYKLGEEFLVYLGLEQNKAEKNKILLKMFIEKKLYNPFESAYKKLLNHLNTEMFDNKKIHNLTLMFELNSHFLKERNKMGTLYDLYFENSNISLCYYLISLFEFGFEFSLQEYDDLSYDSNYVKDILKTLDIEDMMNSFCESDSLLFKITAMNFYLYRAFENTEREEYYFKSHLLFGELLHNMKDSYKIHIFNYMIYFCIKKQNEGNKKFQFELFNLYQEKLSQGLFSDLREKVYMLNSYRDYIYVGIAIREFKWVENFIKKYSKELPEKFREDEVKLSQAKLFFATCSYDKSILNLENIKTVNYLQYTDSSMLKLCCHYELGDYEDAFRELDKLKHYLRNHKEIPDIHKVTITNFTNAFQKLIRIFTQPEKKEIIFLEKEITETKIVAKREWLMEKISQMSN